MNVYEQLLSSSGENVTVIEKRFKSKAKGLCKGNKIGISKDIDTSIEKACVLAEELGHYYTSIGNILDMEDIRNRKQEQQARLWGYNKLIGLTGIIRAFEAGCQSDQEAADYLEVTAEYLHEAIECYKNKYGVYKEVDNYVIYFIPHLAVLKMI